MCYYSTKIILIFLLNANCYFELNVSVTMKKRLNRIYLCFMVVVICVACDNASQSSAPHLSASSNAAIKVLKRLDVKVGDGDLALKGSKVAVHYSGWLYDDDSKDKKGELFDTSSDLGDPLIFVLGQSMVIKGWDEGILGMKVNGKRTLLIPPELAYGSKSIGTARTAIPANSALVFDVELIEVM